MNGNLPGQVRKSDFLTVHLFMYSIRNEWV